MLGGRTVSISPPGFRFSAWFSVFINNCRVAVPFFRIASSVASPRAGLGDVLSVPALFPSPFHFFVSSWISCFPHVTFSDVPCLMSLSLLLPFLGCARARGQRQLLSVCWCFYSVSLSFQHPVLLTLSVGLSCCQYCQ